MTLVARSMSTETLDFLLLRGDEFLNLLLELGDFGLHVGTLLMRSLLELSRSFQRSLDLISFL